MSWFHVCNINITWQAIFQNTSILKVHMTCQKLLYRACTVLYPTNKEIQYPEEEVVDHVSLIYVGALQLKQTGSRVILVPIDSVGSQGGGQPLVLASLQVRPDDRKVTSLSEETI